MYSTKSRSSGSRIVRLVTVVTVIFAGGNVEQNFIIIYIIYYIYNNIVEFGKNFIVTTVTDRLWYEKKFVTLQADSRIMCAGSTDASSVADAVARTCIINRAHTHYK